MVGILARVIGSDSDVCVCVCGCTCTGGLCDPDVSLDPLKPLVLEILRLDLLF